MTLISGSIPNLLNGVSQQPMILRLPTQGAIQVNGYSSVVEGLQKRPPCKHIAKLITGMFGAVLPKWPWVPQAITWAAYVVAKRLKLIA